MAYRVQECFFLTSINLISSILCILFYYILCILFYYILCILFYVFYFMHSILLYFMHSILLYFMNYIYYILFILFYYILCILFYYILCILFIIFYAFYFITFYAFYFMHSYTFFWVPRFRHTLKEIHDTKKVKNPSSRCNIQCSSMQHTYSLASYTTGYLPYQWRVATSEQQQKFRIFYHNISLHNALGAVSEGGSEWVSHAPIATATSDARPRLSLLWQTAISVRCALKPKKQSLQLQWGCSPWGTSWGWRNSWAPKHKTTQDSIPTVEINVWFALRLNELKQSRQGSRY
jgi:hypothetical protein